MNTCLKSARFVVPALIAATAAGCFTVKTESEIKPIHITMDINLKVDKQLDQRFADENHAKPTGKFAEIKKLLDRQVAGIDAKSLLAARTGATDDDKILIAEENARRTKRLSEISRESGVSVEAVQRRYAQRQRERIPAGSGVWYQDESGSWKQK